MMTIPGVRCIKSNLKFFNSISISATDKPLRHRLRQHDSAKTHTPFQRYFFFSVSTPSSSFPSESVSTRALKIRASRQCPPPPPQHSELPNPIDSTSIKWLDP